MTFSGELDGRFRWLWCPDCNKSYSAANKEAHAKKHISRPREGALAPKEVMELLDKTKGEVNHLIRTGRIASFPGNENKPRRWVTKEAIAEYAKGEMERGNLRLMELLTRKKRPQNWMPMPEKK